MSDYKVKGLIAVHRLHYSADAEKSTDGWKSYAKTGQSDTKWEREMEMNARAGALTAVFRESFQPSIHQRALTPPPGAHLLHAWDFGKGYPARVWFSRTPYNGLRIYASKVGQSLQLVEFVPQTIAYEVSIWGEILSAERCFCDPAGNQEKDDGRKSVEVLQGYGFKPRWTGGGNENAIEQAAELMRGLQPDGEPMFLIDPRFNAELCAALGGALKRNKAGEVERTHPFIDLWDATKYGIRGTDPRKTVRKPEGVPFRRDPVSGYGMAVAPAPGHAFVEVTP